MKDSGVRYRRCRTSLWLNPDFLRLSAEAKVVAFYLMTGNQSTSIGAVRLSLAAMAEDLRCTLPRARTLFAECCRALGWLFDPETRLFWMPEWPEINRPQSPNVAKAWRTGLAELPACELRERVRTDMAITLEGLGEGFLKPFAGHIEGFPIRDQEQINEQESGRLPSAVPRDNATNDLFDRFWDAFPRKVAKARAAKAWGRLAPDPELAEEIIRAVGVQASSVQWTRDRGQFIPHAATWLNDRRWEDQVDPVVGMTADPPPPPETDHLAERRRLFERKQAVQ